MRLPPLKNNKKGRGHKLVMEEPASSALECKISLHLDALNSEASATSVLRSSNHIPYSKLKPVVRQALQIREAAVMGICDALRQHKAEMSWNSQALTDAASGLRSLVKRISEEKYKGAEQKQADGIRLKAMGTTAALEAYLRKSRKPIYHSP